jgi:hypothetical protein
MGIKLTIEAETPLSADDRDILAGISAFVFAIANRDDLADQAHVQDEGEQPYCGTVAPDASGSCIREVGHSGRHKYRSINGLVN